MPLFREIRRFHFRLFTLLLIPLAVIPIFAAFDKAENGGGKIFFYDALGAQFECADFATTGSGSVWIRGALYYINRWGEKRLVEMKIEESITVV